MNKHVKKFAWGTAVVSTALLAAACIMPVGDGEDLDEFGNVAPRVESLESIQPLLAQNCGSCHGAGALGGLNVSSFDAAFSSFFVVTGGDTLPRAAQTTAGAGFTRVHRSNPDSSHLYQRITSTGSIKMPPSGDRLDPKIVARIRKWMEDGALIRDTTSSN